MKYFITSDIHSFATELKKSLRKAGFRKNNKEHILVIAGDCWDRGPEAWEVYNYINSIPKSRRILIRGNHEKLFLDLLEKPYPESHDFSNGTVDTFCQIANMTKLDDTLDPELTTVEFLNFGQSEDMFGHVIAIDEECQKLWNKIKAIVKDSEITKFLKSDEWRNYYELDRFIFVHSFIPLNDEASDIPVYYLRGHKYSYKPDWRQSPSSQWDAAVWGCPWQLFKAGLFNNEIENNKVLVCGHWRTGDFYAQLDENFVFYHSCGPIYYSDHLIGLDGGTHHTKLFKTDKYIHTQNVLVIDENFDCYDQSLNKLNK